MLGFKSLFALAFILISSAQANDDHGPFLSKSGAIKIQTWLFYGQAKFSTISNATSGNGEFSNLSPGNRLEIEFYPEDSDLKQYFIYRIRYLVDCEWVSFGTVGSESLNQLKFGLAGSWWVFGNKQRYKVSGSSFEAIRKSEFNVFAGPTVQKFSELQTNVITNQVVGVSHPLLIGMQAGARACLPISETTCVDISGRAVFPIYLTNVLINSMKYFSSVSYYGTVIIDHTFFKHFSAGVGVLGSWSKLDYVNRSAQEQKTQVLVIAPSVSLQVRF